MEAKEPPDYIQKLYNIIFRHRGNPLHTVPITDVTRDEVKLLAFLHGRDAIPADQVRFKGESIVFMAVRSPDGPEVLVPVKNQMDEFKRLAKKYDVLSDLDGIGRGRKYVEDCFKVRLDEFDDARFEEIDPVQAVEQALIAADVKAIPTAAEREEAAKVPVTVTPNASAIGSMFAKSTGNAEGVRP